jgi:hypothetical protein
MIATIVILIAGAATLGLWVPPVALFPMSALKTTPSRAMIRLSVAGLGLSAYHRSLPLVTLRTG